MIAWMLYAALVGTLIAAGAFAVERLVASQAKPRRFVWLAALTLAVVVPLAGGLREPSSTEAFPTAGPPEPAAPGTATMGEGSPGIIAPLSSRASRATARTAGIAWLAGSTAALVVLCSVLVAVACARRRWPRGRVDGTDIYLSRRFGPALAGIVAPRPVLPPWVLEAKPYARDAILRHELEHARARDNVTLLYGFVVAVAFPWSPAIWWMCRRLRAAIEIDCDRRVIVGGVGAADYGAVLLQAGSRSHGRWGLVPAMGRPKSLLERRLRTMIDKRMRLSAVHGALLAAAGLVTLGIACEVPAPTGLNEAMNQVMAAEQNTLDADPARLTGPFLRISRAFERGQPAGSPPPFVFLNDRLLSGPAEASGTTDSGRDEPGVPAGPVHIMSVEILKYSAAQEFLGEEAAGGVIRIFSSRGGSGTGSLNDSLERILAEVESQAANPGVLRWRYSVTGYERRTMSDVDIMSAPK